MICDSNDKRGNMNILAIDTTSTGLSIALIKGDEMFSFTKEIGKSGHSATLMVEVDKLLKDKGVDVNTLDVVGVVVGPGSFTGIRIGVSAMTAIAFATGAKRVRVTSFDLLAYNRGKVLCGVDAGHGNLYLAECEDGRVLLQSFVEAKDAASLNMDEIVFAPCEDTDKVLANVVLKKAQDGDFVDVFEPYYMRKSQAEREKDEV